MGLLFRLLTTPWGLMVLGLCLLAGGGFLIDRGLAPIPNKADLERYDGQLIRVSLKREQRDSSATVGFEVKLTDGETRTFHVPATFAAPKEALLLKPGEAVSILKDGHVVAELTSNGKTIVDFDVREAALKEARAGEPKWGAIAATAGVVFLLLGSVWQFTGADGNLRYALRYMIAAALMPFLIATTAGDWQTYLAYRNAVQNGKPADAMILGSYVKGLRSKHYFLKAAWTGASGKRFQSDEVEVSKGYYEKFQAKPLPLTGLPIRYVEASPPAVAVLEDADSYTEWSLPILILWTVLPTVVFVLFLRKAWRLISGRDLPREGRLFA